MSTNLHPIFAKALAPFKPRECMSYQDYAENFVISNTFDILAQEMFWDDDYSSDTVLQVMEREAKEDGIELTNGEAFDYDKYFYSAYKCTEKGLS